MTTIEEHRTSLAGVVVTKGTILKYINAVRPRCLLRKFFKIATLKQTNAAQSVRVMLSVFLDLGIIDRQSFGSKEKPRDYHATDTDCGSMPMNKLHQVVVVNTNADLCHSFT